MNEHSFMSNTRLIQKRKRKFSDKNIYISLCQFSKRYFSGKNICLLSISIIVENFELFTILMEIFFFPFLYIASHFILFIIFIFHVFLRMAHVIVSVACAYYTVDKSIHHEIGKSTLSNLIGTPIYIYIHM